MKRQYTPAEYINSPTKRGLDLAVAGSVGTFSLVAGTMTAAKIALTDRVLPVFRQERLGKDNAVVKVIKLCTMRSDGSLVHGGERIRHAGLDETPQFINIILGQMSVVGYRPLLAEDANHAASRLRSHFLTDSPFHPDRWLELREQAKPGITGPSQTMSLRPDAGSIGHLADVVAQECAYMEGANLGVDLGFIARTPHALRNGHNPTVMRAVEPTPISVPVPRPATDALVALGNLSAAFTSEGLAIQ